MKHPKNAAQHFDIPVLFDSAEADSILAALQAFPPDDPCNEDVSQRQTVSDSQATIASIGADKPLDFNLDMNFILVPPNQPRVPVKTTLYLGESDPGPFPAPDIMPIENWPLRRNEDTGALSRWVQPWTTSSGMEPEIATASSWIRLMECFTRSTRLEKQARTGSRRRLLRLV